MANRDDDDDLFDFAMEDLPPISDRFDDDELNIFSGEVRGFENLWELLRRPDVTQIMINSHDQVFYSDSQGKRAVTEPWFPSQETYLDAINSLLKHTDSRHADIRLATVPTIEASLVAPHSGSIHICTSQITRGEPILTIRKQPEQAVSLDTMMSQGMMNHDMRRFLEKAVRGHLNIIISGSSGSGKTTLARALAEFIDPSDNIVTIEDIDELHLGSRLTDVRALTTFTGRDEFGNITHEVTLDDLVRQTLRMRADRVWVGESRGREAAALVKVAASGTAGCVTTIHAPNGQRAIDQLISYVMEAGIVEDVARKSVKFGFQLVVQIKKVSPTRRVITEITELEPVTEQGAQRVNRLWEYDSASENWRAREKPGKNIRDIMAEFGVQADDYPTPPRR